MVCWASARRWVTLSGLVAAARAAAVWMRSVTGLGSGGAWTVASASSAACAWARAARFASAGVCRTVEVAAAAFGSATVSKTRPAASETRVSKPPSAWSAAWATPLTPPAALTAPRMRCALAPRPPTARPAAMSGTVTGAAMPAVAPVKAAPAATMAPPAPTPAAMPAAVPVTGWSSARWLNWPTRVATAVALVLTAPPTAWAPWPSPRPALWRMPRRVAAELTAAAMPNATGAAAPPVRTVAVLAAVMAAARATTGWAVAKSETRCAARTTGFGVACAVSMFAHARRVMSPSRFMSSYTLCAYSLASMPWGSLWCCSAQSAWRVASLHAAARALPQSSSFGLVRPYCCLGTVAQAAFSMSPFCSIC